MFEYQIREMKATIQKHLDSGRPPEKVGVKHAHAVHLGVTFESAPPVNENRPSGLKVGLVYGSVVMVTLHELFLALKDAKGVDAPDYSAPASPGTAPGTPSDHLGEIRTPNPDHGKEPPQA